MLVSLDPSREGQLVIDLSYPIQVGILERTQHIKVTEDYQ
jgi:hypothetical protein